MKSAMRKILGFLLCVTMLLGDNAIMGFCTEFDVNPNESIVTEEAGAEGITWVNVSDNDISAGEEGASVTDETTEPSEEEPMEPSDETAEAEFPVASEEDFVTDPADAAFTPGDLSTYPYCCTLDSNNEITIDQYYWADPENKQTVNNLVIPSEIDGHTVTAIGDRAFSRDSSYLAGTITLPETLVRIGNEAFSGCSNLTGNLDIPDSVKNIGKEAFKGCFGFDSIKLSWDTQVDKTAFDGCFINLKFRSASYELLYDIDDGNAVITGYKGSGIYKLVIPDYYYEDGKAYPVTAISLVKNSHYTIDSVIWGNNLKKIDDNAFGGVQGRMNIGTLPDSLTDIGAHAFDGKALDTDLVIPSWVETIGDYAFADCENLTSVSVPDTAIIGEGAFPDTCTVTKRKTYSFTTAELADGTLKITEITGRLPENLVIPAEIEGETVTVIGDEALAYQFFGGTLTLPDTITKIENNAFQRSSFSGNLNIPGSVKEIGEFAFEGVIFDGKLNLSEGLTQISQGAFMCCEWIKGDLCIPDSVIKIESSAFESCVGLKSVSIYAPFILNGNVFVDCDKNLKITYRSEDKYKLTYEINGSEATITGYIGEPKGDLIIPETIEGATVTEIADHAFKNDGDISFDGGSLTLPTSLKKIGCEAFRGNSFKGELVIPAGVETIGDRAFAECTKFTGNLVIPDSMNSIGIEAFSKCSGMTGTLTFPSDRYSPLSIGDEAFSNAGFTGKVTIPYCLNPVGTNPFNMCKGIDEFENNGQCEVDLPYWDGCCFEWYEKTSGEKLMDRVIRTNQTAYKAGTETLFYEGIAPEGYTYTGSAIKPAISVLDYNKCDGVVDCSVSYKNNTKPYAYKEGESGFSAGKAPSVTVTLKGNRSGKKTFYFTISKKGIEDDDVVIGDITPVIASSKSVKPVPTITYGTKKLKNKTDFTVAYYATEACDGDKVTPKAAGKYYIKVTGKGNFTGSKVKEFTISPNTQKLVSKLTVSKISGQKYTGTGIEPAVTVKDGKTPLVVGKKGETPASDCDVWVSYSNNTDVGTATVLIEGTGAEGAKYVGSKKTTFKITALASMSKVKVSGIYNLRYSGYGQEQPSLKLRVTIDGVEYDDIPYINQEIYDADPVGEGREYGAVVSYSNNVNKGTATIKITGVNGLSGSIKKKFTIKAYDIKENPGSEKVTVTLLNDGQAEYSKAGAKPEPEVRFGANRLIKGKDYTVTYSNNTALWNASTGSTKKVPTVKITGKGNFTGTITQTFEIVPKNWKGPNSYDIKISAPDKVYKNAAGNGITTVTVTDNGKKLSSGKDYTVKYTYKYDTDVIDTSQKSKPTIKRAQGEEVSKKDIVPAGITIQATITATENGNYTGDDLVRDYRIIKQDINSLKISVKSQTYTGEEIRLEQSDFTFKNNKKDDVTFTILSYKNNTNKGKASVTIQGYGNYGGTRTLTFTIGARKILNWFK